ncbi:hypothetical protein E2C01_077410 [Portunus trituberculatus]|uniref:Uncharacterized protein n=1 Tax=Portunus trituberculatus TaxID=210409 RepID=A0A5B7IPM7_PORTR|nr:hypothetical protein [Portunus trituberculatus]
MQEEHQDVAKNRACATTHRLCECSTDHTENSFPRYSESMSVCPTPDSACCWCHSECGVRAWETDGNLHGRRGQG